MHWDHLVVRVAYVIVVFRVDGRVDGMNLYIVIADSSPYHHHVVTDRPS